MMGRWLRAAGHAPDQVLCSPARRARETWQLVQGGLGDDPPVTFADGVYQGSAARLLAAVHGTLPAIRALMLVGHQPAIQELALTLAAGTGPADGEAAARAALDRMRGKFPTAAVAVLAFTGDWDQLTPGTAALACFVTPRTLLGQDGGRRAG